MPQFDVTIIFTIVNNLFFFVIFYYLLTLKLVLNNMILNKFRTKNLKLKNILQIINKLNYVLVLKIN